MIAATLGALVGVFVSACIIGDEPSIVWGIELPTKSCLSIDSHLVAISDVAYEKYCRLRGGPWRRSDVIEADLMRTGERGFDPVRSVDTAPENFGDLLDINHYTSGERWNHTNNPRANFKYVSFGTTIVVIDKLSGDIQLTEGTRTLEHRYEVGVSN